MNRSNVWADNKRLEVLEYFSVILLIITGYDTVMKREIK